MALELRHRDYARVDDGTRVLEGAGGLAIPPFDGALAKAEPKTIRDRVLHTVNWPPLLADPALECSGDGAARVGTGTIDAQRSSRRIKGSRDTPCLVEPVHAEGARRLAGGEEGVVTRAKSDQAA